MSIRNNFFTHLPSLAVKSENINVLYSAKSFRQYLFEMISKAKLRIYLMALYLENDETGRELLTALYRVKQANPSLDIKICVDWHRAQRGLIGAKASEGNAVMYYQFTQQYKYAISVYGVPVRSKEVFGVLHLKGFIIDDTVIYSGASLNNIYLHYQDRYRFDRYHIVQHASLANSMVDFISHNIISQEAVYDLAQLNRPSTKQIKADIRNFRNKLRQARYTFIQEQATLGDVQITPLVGVGKKDNQLNKIILKLLASAQKEIFICTPYFNFPYKVYKQIKVALKRGIKVILVVGDKKANDFFIPPKEQFKTIGGLPYLYEMNLRSFAKANEANIAAHKLLIHLWSHEENSYHLKGIWVDKEHMLLTGSNLNPRAWGLDLENGLLIYDKDQLLVDKFTQEQENILQNTQLISTYKQIPKLETYPDDAKRLLKRITRIKADKLLKKIL